MLVILQNETVELMYKAKAKYLSEYRGKKRPKKTNDIVINIALKAYLGEQL